MVAEGRNSGKGKSLSQASLDSREVGAGERSDGSLHDLLIHSENLGDPDRTGVSEPAGRPVAKRAIPEAGSTVESGLAADRTADQIG